MSQKGITLGRWPVRDFVLGFFYLLQGDRSFRGEMASRVFPTVSQLYHKPFFDPLKVGLIVVNKRLTLPHTPDFVHLRDDADIRQFVFGKIKKFCLDELK